MNAKTFLILAGDIGGTNSRFALFECGPQLALTAQVTLPSKGYGSFAQLMEDLITKLPAHPAEARAAALAVAGPVKRGRSCFPPNVGYLMDLDALPAGMLPGANAMINDFTALSMACRQRGLAGSLPLLDGVFDPGLTQAVVGAGTGLGKTAMVPDGRGGVVLVSSEGGHAAFPFLGSQERAFEDYVLKATGEPFARFETVVSGQGLALAHGFLTGERLSPAAVSAKLTPQSETTALFARLYGRACRDYVLEVLATGGLYVCAGVAAKNRAVTGHRAFAEEFRNSHTHPELMAEIGVRLMPDESAGLWGAAAYALTLLDQPPAAFSTSAAAPTKSGSAAV